MTLRAASTSIILGEGFFTRKYFPNVLGNIVEFSMFSLEIFGAKAIFHLTSLLSPQYSNRKKEKKKPSWYLCMVCV